MPLTLRIALVLLSSALLLSPASADPAPADKGVNLYLAAAGVALLAGGGAFAFAQNREADRDMRIYRRSAFSVHTEDYRERVEEHQRLTWAGLAGAALGGILLVVSF
jgi:hypothetical protein